VTGSTGFATFETELTSNDAFVCALTPDSVILSGTSGRVVSAQCLAATPGPGYYTDPKLWVPVGRRPAAPDAPPAMVARIGDAAAGFCLSKPPRGPMLVAAALPPPGPQPQLVARYPDTSAALLFTVPPDVTAMRVAGQGGTRGAVDCPIIDDLAMCTIDVQTGQVVVVTASTAADPRGVQVYWG
jgi:hypothetical protein